ncbi:MAG: M20/M25/M40 family metallo-hydrolase [Chloroflexota bacterium]
MSIDVVDLTKTLINFPSVSRDSNVPITDYLEDLLNQLDFVVERLEYDDENGVRKASLVAQKGEGQDGLAFFSHTDTVPGQEEDWDAFTGVVENNRVIGRGSCDMKGPLAATIGAAVNIDAAQLKRPVFIGICADEEVGGGGAKQIVAESQLFKAAYPKHGVIAEPTQLIPVYAHKGGAAVTVTARGEAAHTSTDKGTSANFLIIPFLNDMLALSQQVKTDTSFMDEQFSPPTCGFNLVLDDGGCRPNVTAAKTVATVGFRTMPDARSRDLLNLVTDRANHYGFEVDVRFIEPLYTPLEADIVQAACQSTGISTPETVPFGTDAFWIKDHMALVVLGPGNIQQAHRVGEWISIDQLHQATSAYQSMIEMLCF